MNPLQALIAHFAGMAAAAGAAAHEQKRYARHMVRSLRSRRQVHHQNRRRQKLSRNVLRRERRVWLAEANLRRAGLA